MANYVTKMSEWIGAACARAPRVVLFGENINNGSRIVGLCRNLVAPEGGRIINVGDCEATHIGAGFGLMLNGVHAVLFAKQYDFMLLGLDQLVNTYNFIRASRSPLSLGAFTIVGAVCDQGYQGPQSSFNSLGDLCSMARLPGFTLTNMQDAHRVIHNEIAKPGFRFIAFSQRLFAGELLDPGYVWNAADFSLFQYSEGEDVTIVCFNFALPDGHELRTKLQQRGLRASLFSVNYVFPLEFARILHSVQRTRRLVVIDDSKSVHLAAHRLLYETATAHPEAQRLLIERGTSVRFGVCADALDMNYEHILGQLAHARAA